MTTNNGTLDDLRRNVLPAFPVTPIVASIQTPSEMARAERPPSVNATFRRSRGIIHPTRVEEAVDPGEQITAHSSRRFAIATAVDWQRQRGNAKTIKFHLTLPPPITVNQLSLSTSSCGP